MNLDPCPWCKDTPKVEKYITYFRSWPEFTEINMVKLSCCRIEVEAEEDSIEEQWNWMEQWNLK